MPPPGVCLDIIKEQHRKEGYGTPENPVKFLNQDFQTLQQNCLAQGTKYVDAMFPPDSNAIGQGLLTPEEMQQVKWARPTFWRFGQRYDVVIDDKLPVLDEKLIFVHRKTDNEFWPALLEKAYAKVYGSYADMKSGAISEALIDFTGGIHMMFELKDAPSDLFEVLQRAAKSNSLMGCGTPDKMNPTSPDVLPNGIVTGHAYAVTDVTRVTSRGKPIKLVRLWNPWGKGEWKGDWSDQMCMEDWRQRFDSVDICCLCPDFLDDSPSGHWVSSFHEGRWVAGTTAGGHPYNKDTFWTNPQYRVRLDKPEKEDHQGKNNMLISLMQKPKERNRRLMQKQRGKFPASFFNHTKPVSKTKAHINSREVMKLSCLKPGEYLIVPSTYKPNEAASFILAILSKNRTHIV
ncbi:hypothetical protein JZ751_022069 [Albula glossodonta]|uniref:Calpain catalytic domain-containing protein n=1 Tax=Albula glossodonta TaxID=121402 RepID=A0A8T2MQW3_9TELE|nr:hypothetical protein JZ751_022069 [Albula glossodonta]